jgi:hypothetical protein
MDRVSHFLRRILSCDEATSLAEFAISLPLLVVLVVGIFDFGGAFNQKQELNNAVREGARFGAAQPTNDLCFNSTCASPPSVDAIRVLVDSYLLAAKLNDCGLGTLAIPNGTSPTWVYQTTGTCPGQLTLTITRGFATAGGCGLTATYSAGTVNIPCTWVQIQYPYAWHFNSVIQLLVPGSHFALSTLNTSSTVPNMN